MHKKKTPFTSLLQKAAALVRRPVVSLFASASLLGAADQAALASQPHNAQKDVLAIRQTALENYLLHHYGMAYEAGSNPALDRVLDTSRGASGMFGAVRQILGDTLTARDVYVRRLRDDSLYYRSVFSDAYGKVRSDLLSRRSSELQLISPLEKTVITSPYGPRRRPTPRASAFHPGTDLGAAPGTKVYAVGDMRLESSEKSKGLTYVTGQLLDDAGRPTGYYVQYLHVNPVNTRKTPIGSVVRQGEVVTTVGPRDWISTGSHLDYKIFTHDASGKRQLVNTTQLLKNGNVLKLDGKTEPKAPYSHYIMAKLQQDKTGRIFENLPKIIEDDLEKGVLTQEIAARLKDEASEINRAVRRTAYSDFMAGREKEAVAIASVVSEMDRFKNIILVRNQQPVIEKPQQQPRPYERTRSIPVNEVPRRQYAERLEDNPPAQQKGGRRIRTATENSTSFRREDAVLYLFRINRNEIQPVVELVPQLQPVSRPALLPA